MVEQTLALKLKHLSVPGGSKPGSRVGIHYRFDERVRAALRSSRSCDYLFVHLVFRFSAVPSLAILPGGPRLSVGFQQANDDGFPPCSRDSLQKHDPAITPGPTLTPAGLLGPAGDTSASVLQANQRLVVALRLNDQDRAS